MYKNRKNYAYEILGLESNASPEQIFSAYKAKVRNIDYHDRKKLNQLNMAYDILTNNYDTNFMMPIFPDINRIFNDFNNFNNFDNFFDENNYSYKRSFTKSMYVDKDGKLKSKSYKYIDNNGKKFKESKYNDGNKIIIKRMNNDGTIKTYEKPFEKPYVSHKSQKSRINNSNDFGNYLL
jgi:DnaJ-class molecular chaperone with C-terminal Zn finger domain